MAPSSQSTSLAGPAVMLFSAAIFGYFGWGVTWISTGNAGQFLVYVAILDWTLKIASIGFAAAAMITFASAVIGNAVFCVVGLLGAIGLAIVLVLDMLDPQHMTVHPILLALFVGWNAYASWTGLQSLREEVRAARSQSEASQTP